MMSINRNDLLNAIEQGLLASEMAVKFQMHDLNLYNEINKLENCGYTLHRTYYSDGQFKYEFGADNKKNIKTSTDIISKSNEKQIKILCMSDLHYGSPAVNKEMTNAAYKHAKDNNIHLIFVPGDIFEGKIYPASEYKEGVNQVKLFLNEFPYDNDILVFGIGGDHDETIYKEDYLDPLKVITKTRHNIVLPSYFNARFNIKNCTILLRHDNSKKRIYPNDLRNYQLLIRGHSHCFKFYAYKTNSSITIPTTSNLNLHAQGIEGYVELTLFFNDDNCLQKVETRQFTVIAGKEILLGISTNTINIVKVHNHNIEDYNHEIIVNPYPYVEIKDESTLVNELNNEKDDLLKELKDTKALLEKYQNSPKVQQALREEELEKERRRKEFLELVNKVNGDEPTYNNDFKEKDDKTINSPLIKERKRIKKASILIAKAKSIVDSQRTRQERISDIKDRYHFRLK